MNTAQERFRAFLALQRDDYQRALPEKLAQLQALWAGLDKDAAPPALSELERHAHTLAGTAGTLGFREVGLAAKSLEELLARAGEGGAALTPGQRSEISLALAALQASLPAD
ncbi:MAG: Hpt domain-containing protein [Pseudomonadota bacterium]|uniref:Hpt domain-containing protein n=1 Tax=Polaromonas sp. TaxID=1869339 RepID=UPI0017F2EC2B|nr:Hpt domain-containing protein [Polaromonas sp.]MBA3593435.1 Hpt domain-containing protein [Polaromonas sp.]MDQ3270749.1 Hpt domain-containing protein [Pseudomonadota bacterium]